MLFTTLTLALSAAVPVLSSIAPAVPATTYSDCQKKTDNALEGCPDGTIYVSASDTAADFQSIQAAIRSLPNDTSSHVILIGAGTYNEQLNVTRSGPVHLLGQSDLPSQKKQFANITYSDNSSNDVVVFFHLSNGGVFPDNLYASVLAIGPTFDATRTGSGPTGAPVPEDTPFGCTDFRAYNIDFRNEVAQISTGPAHAFAVGYANAGFYSCGFYSYQDTLYTGKLGNVILYDSIVAGQTDFLYGFGTMFVEKSTLLLRNCGGGITAWKGTNTTYPNKFGVYVSDSQIIANNATILETKFHKCSLGRPWNSIHRSVIMNTYFDDAVLPQGYTKWGNNPENFSPVLSYMATYDNYGPGNDVAAQRAGNITRVIEKQEVKAYFRPRDVFQTWKGEQSPVAEWIDPAALKSCRWRS